MPVCMRCLLPTFIPVVSNITQLVKLSISAQFVTSAKVSIDCVFTRLFVLLFVSRISQKVKF